MPSNDTNVTPSQTVTYSQPQPQVVNNSSNSSNTNLTSNLTAEQAKNIAMQNNPGYSVGQPIQGSVMVNNSNHNVWIIPLSLNGMSKTIYIDTNTGLIVLNT
ncbi:MAG: peptidase [Methanobacterium sp.]